MKKFWRPHLAWLGLSLGVLAGCGGGGSDAGTPPEPLPVGLQVSGDTRTTNINGIFNLRVYEEFDQDSDYEIRANGTSFADSVGTNVHFAENDQENSERPFLGLYIAVNSSGQIKHMTLVQRNLNYSTVDAWECGDRVNTSCGTVRVNTTNSTVEVDNTQLVRLQLGTTTPVTPASTIRIRGALQKHPA